MRPFPDEGSMHDELRTLIQSFADLYGLRINSLRVDWMCTASITHKSDYTAGNISMEIAGK